MSDAHNPVPPCERREISVVSLNLHWGRGADGRIYDVAEACASLNADVILLQEVTGPPEGPSTARIAADCLQLAIREVILSELIDHERGVWLDHHSASSGTWGLAILTRFPIAHHTVEPLGQGRRDPPRVAQVADLQLGSGVIRVINTHLTNRVIAASAQLIRLRRVVVRSPNVPTVIAGDLNLPSWTLTAMGDLRRAVHRATWPAAHPIMQLDHILLLGQIDSSGAATAHNVGSDHLAVRADLTVMFEPARPA